MIKIFLLEMKMIIRQNFSWLMPVLFFALIVCLFPLSLGPDAEILKIIAPGILWVAALLSVLLSMHNLFRYDAEDGFIDNLLLSAHPLPLIILIKVFSHW